MFRRTRRRVRLLIADSSQRDLDEQLLSVFWEAWGFLGGFDYVVKITDPSDLVGEVRRVVPAGVTVDEWEFAGHGRSGAPLVDGKPITAQMFADALGAFVRNTSTGWLRCCDAFQGIRGQRFAVELASKLQHAVFGHTRVVSQRRAGRTYGSGWFGKLRAQADLALAIAGGVLFQSGGCGVRPGDEPGWSAEDQGYSGPNQPNTVLLTRRHPPRAWLSP